MGYHDVRFPTDISYGSHFGPGFKHSVVQTRSGHRQFTSHHADDRRTYDVAYGIKSPAQLHAVVTFYLARGGISNSFRFQDPSDMNSTSTPWVIEGGASVSPSSDDQVIVSGATAAQTTAQLIKRYADAGGEYVRNVYLPVSGTVVMEKELPPGSPTVMTEGVDFTVDYATGVVTFLSGGLPENTIVRAGFEFDVKARFDASIDALLDVTYADFAEGGVPGGVPITSEIDSIAHNDMYDYGEGSYHAASFSWNPAVHGRCLFLAAGVTTIVMPNPADLPRGGLYGYWKNTSGGTVAVKDQAGNTLFSITTGTGALVVNMLGSGGNEWVAFA